MEMRYSFTNAKDMIRLAKYVEDKVYRGSAFTDEDDVTRGYCDFWRLCEKKESVGYTSVTIDEDGYVIFSK